MLEQRLRHYVKMHTEQAMPINRVERFGEIIPRDTSYDKPNQSDKSFFTQRDTKIINNPNFFRQLTLQFSKCPYQFNILFVNHPAKSYFTKWHGDKGAGQINFDYIKKHAADLAAHLQSVYNKNNITVLILSNSIVGGMPLTPWIVAHRIAHSFSDNLLKGNIIGTTRSPMKILEHHVSKIFTALEAIYEVIYAAAEKDEDEDYSINRMTTYDYIFTFRSARTDALFSNEKTEAHIELLAQYIITGRIVIKTNVTPAFEDYCNKNNIKLSDTLAKSILNVNTVLKRAKPQIEMAIIKVMNAAVGNIFAI